MPKTKTTKLFTLLATCALSAVSAPAFAAEDAEAEAAHHAEEKAESRTVTVQGLGEVMVTPDSMRANVSVRVRGPSLAQARTDAARRTRTVIMSLEGLRIQALDIQTEQISVTPVPERQPEFGEATPPRIIGYDAESRLTVTLRDVSIEQLRAQGSRILDTALAAGANSVGGVQFFLNEPREAHRLALAAAVRDAEANAQVMAGAANVTLSGLSSLSTEVERGYAYGQAALYSMEVAGATSFPVEPGDITVTTQVIATFRFDDD